MITPEELGLTRCDLSDLQGGKTSEDAAAIMRGVLSGDQGSRREMTLLNSGAALMVAGKAENLANGIELAAACIDSGRAIRKLEELVSYTEKAAN